MKHVATADPLQVHVPFGCRSEYQGLCSGTCICGGRWACSFPLIVRTLGKRSDVRYSDIHCAASVGAFACGSVCRLSYYLELTFSQSQLKFPTRNPECQISESIMSTLSVSE